MIGHLDYLGYLKSFEIAGKCIWHTRILFLLLFGFNTKAQDTLVNLSSPYHTLRTHLYFLQPETYEATLSSASIYPKGLSKQERIDYAIKIKKIFDKNAEIIDISTVPKDSNYVNTFSNTHYYVPVGAYPNIFLEKIEGRWYYAQSSLVAADDIFSKMYIIDIEHWLMNLGIEQGKFLGIYTWQYVIILIFILAFILIRRLSRLILSWQISNRFGKLKQPISKILTPVTRPLSYFIALFCVYNTSFIIGLPIQVYHHLQTGIAFLLALTLTVVIYRIINITANNITVFFSKNIYEIDKRLIPFTSNTLKVLVIVAGVLFMLNAWGININTILAGISIGGVAVALAAQDTIKNLFGSIMILLDRPFIIGDWILSDGLDGTVEDIGFRSTRVRTFKNSVISIPNGNIATMTIDNMGARRYRRFKTYIGVTYDTPAYVIEIFVEELRQIVKAHPKTLDERYYIYLHSFNASSIDVLFYIFFDAENWAEELRLRQEMMLSIIRLANKMNVRFAFPTQTLFVEEVPGKEALTPSYPAKEELEQMLKNSKPI